MDRTRIAILAALLLLPLAGLQARLVQLQLLDPQKYVGDLFTKKQSVHLAPAPRGKIRDRKGVVLAEDRRSFDCYIVLDEYERAPGPLAKLLGMPEVELVAEIDAIYEKIERQIQRRPAAEHRRLYYRERRTPYLLKRGIEFEEALAIETAPHLYRGAVVRESLKRRYPKGPVGCHLLGYLGPITGYEARFREMLQDGTLTQGFQDLIGDDGIAQLYRRGAFHDELVGIMGVEKRYNDELRGKSGLVIFEREPGTSEKKTIELLPAQAGEDLELTVDIDLQEKIERLLDAEAARQLKRHLAAVVLEPHTGEAIVLASNARYDPNAFTPPRQKDEVRRILGDNEGKPLQSRAFAQQYQLGSIFKVVTAAAGLEERKVRTDELLACRGRFLENSRFFNCMIWRRNNGMHGELALTAAMEVSCNCYFYEVGRRCGLPGLARWGSALGYGSATGLDVPGEARGRLPGRPKWQNDELSLAIGQNELMVSPLQVAVMMAAVANGGYRITPHLRRKDAPARAPAGLSAETLAALRRALHEVVHGAHGTARSADLGKFGVAGKTSSAQALDRDRNEISHAWFAGYAPHDKPRYVVVVFVEAGGHGGESAAPVAAKIFELLLGQP